MPGLVPGIHVLTRWQQEKTWMALAEATPSFGRLRPAMTKKWIASCRYGPLSATPKSTGCSALVLQRQPPSVF
jgi:hypothetical protein